MSDAKHMALNQVRPLSARDFYRHVPSDGSSSDSESSKESEEDEAMTASNFRRTGLGV